ncbi:MAG TPA: hypothetical protein VGM88_00575 [Kofleriaceae bacterium]|jgi:hypothetical protein
MSTGNPPKGGGGKPFLGDDDLANELDAWDATFDALHIGPEPGEATDPAPVHTISAWPADATKTSVDLRLDARGEPAAVVTPLAPAPAFVPQAVRPKSEAEPEPLEEQLTLDRAVADEDPTTHTSLADVPVVHDPNETDFSDIGADAPPAALGDLLGSHDDGPTSILARHDDGPTTVRPRDSMRSLSTRITRPPTVDVELDHIDDDEVLTSASRPPAPPSAGADDVLDDIAPPPAPEPARRTPAIVRRAPVERATPPGGYDIQPGAFGEEHTRIADANEMEERAQATRSQRPTSPPPIVDDDYADLEIGSIGDDDEPEISHAASESERPGSEGDRAPELFASQRRTAHVLRRTDAPTRPPPPVSQGTPVARDMEPAAPRAHTGSEDDFSDIAIDDDSEVEIETSGPVASLDDALGSLGLDEGVGSRPTPPGGVSVTPPVPPVPVAPPPPTGTDFPAIDTMKGIARPPELKDVYPRVKTPTSVPPITGVPAALQPPSIGPAAPRAQPPGPPPRSRAPSIAPLPAAPEAPASSIGSAPIAVPAAPIAASPSQPVRSGPVPIARVDLHSASLRDAARAGEAVLSGQAASDAPPEVEPLLDLDTAARAWPEQLPPLAQAALDEASAQALLVYEREIATVDETAASAALRVEAGRLCERLTDFDRARAHYDAALLADPRATAALRGLRRLARASGDLGEATRHLEAEIEVAGALERRPLGHYRVDLLMASGEQDLARVAVGEILDSAPSDVRALLAQLELAFLDGRADEFGVALEQLAHAVTDPELRAAVHSARGALAAHHNDTGAAAAAFAAAAEADGSSLAARLGAIRQASSANDSNSAARALGDLATQVADPTTAAAAALRAQHWAQQIVDGASASLRDAARSGQAGPLPSKTNADAGTAMSAAAIATATQVAPDDPLVARLAAEAAAAGTDAVVAGNAFAHWAKHAGSPAEKAYAAARAAELDPARAAELWASALVLDPGDDYGAAQLRTAHVAAESTQQSIDVDLGVAIDAERDRARLRAAYGLIAQGKLDEAIEILATGHASRPGSLALAEALGEALAAAGKWSDRAKLFAELADSPGEQLDKDVAQLRSALAWEEAVGAATQAPETDETRADLQKATAAGLEAWDRVLERGSSPSAHAAAILLATRLGDREIINDVLARAQAAERSPWAAASLALRRARLVADDPQRAEQILRGFAEQREAVIRSEGDREAADPALDDPRRTVALVTSAARQKELGDAASALEERARVLAVRGASLEVAALRLRAAQLALDAGHAARATGLLREVEQALPGLGVVSDLLAAARRRAGDRPSVESHRRREPTLPPPTGAGAADAFARLVRDADLAASHNDAAAALALYQRALELRPGDPLAAVPLVRVATASREAAPVAALALARLRAAEDAGDGVAKAAAYELLAHIDGELRGDAGSAQMAIESAAQADPSRVDLLQRLARAYAAGDQLAELSRLRKAELDATPPERTRDRTALQLDLAALGVREDRPEYELMDQYRAVIGADPKARLALLQLEMIVRRAGFSAELAELEEKIADYFEGDAKTQAAFLTRAGESLAELGRIDEAVLRFGRAEQVLPGHVPALEGWRQAALKGQLWLDVAEAATRQAAGAPDAAQKAALHHFAGVALMDKALLGERAMDAFQRALAALPDHRDSFLRLRILLEEDANHDDLATLLARRLEVERDPAAQIELHRALAELHRNFLSDRDTAKIHYRAILEADPNDLRAHAAVADISWEQGNWQDAADALMARARLERAPEILKTLCFRLGLIYADRLVDVPMALKAFQRALTYQPDDENTLVRLADLSTQVGEYKLALAACERLVKNETDPDRRAAHLHRVARIFKVGFGDLKRAERALNLALDGAPTNDDALTALVQFYKESNDITSVRVHLRRVAGAMRARVALDPQDGVAYRVIARANAALAQANVPGSLPIARCAAELAELLGTSGEPEQRLLQTSPQPDLSGLLRPEADEVLFPRGVQVELRQIFQLLGDRIAKHVGVDLRPYGATRGDRLRAKDNAVAAVAQSVATGLGFGEIDVYVSQRQPWAMVAEPTSPVSLVIGVAIAQGGGDAIRFAAGGALKLAQSSLAIPARLSVDELGVLVTALLRLFQPDFPIDGVDADAVAAQAQKLRRLIPTGLLQELKPYALAIDPQRFRHVELSRDLKVAGLRAGLVASSSLLAGLRILAAQADGTLPAFLGDPVAQGLITFALGEDHAVVAR